MTETEFWRLIDESLEASEEDLDAQATWLVTSLAARSVHELVAFQRWMDRFWGEAYRAELWGAAHIIRGGCADDCFECFRCWLISRGERAFRAALRAPDSLAEVARSSAAEFEAFGYVAADAYERKFGEGDFFELFPEERQKLAGDLSSWSTNHHLDETKARALYPRLMERFCS